MNASPEEALWVLRAQYNDREALELLLRRVRPSMLRYLRGLVGVDDAEDVLQDVLVLVYRKLRWLGNPELFRPWAFRIASRAAFRHLKRKNRLPRNIGEDVLDTIPADHLRPTDDDLNVLSTIDGVSPSSRAVLVLHFKEEMPLAEIAAVLELPLGTVKSRLAYGLTVLRKRLADKRSGDVKRIGSLG